MLWDGGVAIVATMLLGISLIPVNITYRPVSQEYLKADVKTKSELKNNTLNTTDCGMWKSERSSARTLVARLLQDSLRARSD